MIRWTKDGKVSRWRDAYGSVTVDNVSELAAAIDIAVAALRECAMSGSWTMDGARDAYIATKALRQIGADHAD